MGLDLNENKNLELQKITSLKKKGADGLNELLELVHSNDLEIKEKAVWAMVEQKISKEIKNKLKDIFHSEKNRSFRETMVLVMGQILDAESPLPFKENSNQESFFYSIHTG